MAVATRIRARLAAGIPILGALLVSGPALAQTDTASYFLSGQAVPLTIHLDSLGVYAPGVVDPDSIVTLGASLGFVGARDVGQGIFIVALSAELTRPALVALARQAVLLGGGIRAAGLAVRPLESPDPVIITDQFVVEFLPGITAAQVDVLNATYGVVVAKKLAVLENDYLLAATPASPLDALDLANLYNADPLAAFASPDFIARNRERAIFPNDDLFPSQWHLHNTVNDADIDAPEAWDFTTGSPGTVIAILEVFGFDVSNRDIAENLLHAWSFAGCGSTDSFDVATPCGSGVFLDKLHHGTAVAGLAAGQGNNGEGIAGVCFECNLMLIELPVTDAALAGAVDYAVAKGADVINNSWGRDISSTLTVTAFNDAATNGRAGKGTVVVWGVWDKDEDRCIGANADLASLPTGIAVASSNNLDRRGSPTGFGSCIDLLAPGFVVKTTGATAVSASGLTTADRTGDRGYNNKDADPMPCEFTEPALGTGIAKPLDYTKCFAGASAAGPIVAGVAGLMLSLRPCLERTQVQEILTKAADKIDAAAAGYDAITGHSPTHGYGRVNAAAALDTAASISCSAELVTPPRKDEEEGVEIGTRFGATRLWGGVDRTVVNLPGSGPLSEPVLYAAWPLGAGVRVQFQLGGGVSTGGPTPDERLLVAALQPELAFSSVFVGPSVGLRVLGIGTGPTVTDFAAGIAAGYRLLPLPFLALRLEGRYRRWFTSPATDELGLALAFGVVLN